MPGYHDADLLIHSCVYMMAQVIAEDSSNPRALNVSRGTVHAHHSDGALR